MRTTGGHPARFLGKLSRSGECDHAFAVKEDSMNEVVWYRTIHGHWSGKTSHDFFDIINIPEDTHLYINIWPSDGVRIRWHDKDTSESNASALGHVKVTLTDGVPTAVELYK